MSDKEKGLYNKYEVKRRNDPDGKHDECNYFVLDIKHDKFASVALRAYSEACRKEYPELSKDVQNLANEALANAVKNISPEEFAVLQKQFRDHNKMVVERMIENGRLCPTCNRTKRNINCSNAFHIEGASRTTNE